MKQIKTLLPHITIILCVTFIVLWILDYFNPLMGFLTSWMPKALLLVLLLCAAATSIFMITYQRKQ